MAPGRGHLQRAPGLRLPADLAEIGQRSGVFPGLCIRRGRRNEPRAGQVGQQRRHVRHRVDADSLHDRPFGGVFPRDIAAAEAALAGLHHHGQHAAHRAGLPAQRKLPEKHAARKVGRKLPAGLHQRDQQRQVVQGALFFLVGGGQVHGDAAHRELVPAVFHRGAHTVARFLDGGVRQAHHLEGGQAGGKVRLHLHGERVHPVNPHAVKLCDHAFLLLATGAAGRAAVDFPQAIGYDEGNKSGGAARC